MNVTDSIVTLLVTLFEPINSGACLVVGRTEGNQTPTPDGKHCLPIPNKIGLGPISKKT